MSTIATSVGSDMPERRGRATKMAAGQATCRRPGRTIFDARLPIASALSALMIVLLMPEVTLAATSRPPTSAWSVSVKFAGLTLFFLGLPGLGLAIYLAIRRTWIVIGVPVLAIVLPLSAIFQWQNPAIANLPGKLLAVIVTMLAVGLLLAAGIGLAKLLIREATRIGAATTALAMTLPFALGIIAPLCGLVLAETVSRLSPEPALALVAGPVVLGLLALVPPLAWLSRSVAATTIGTIAGLFLLPLWSVAVSNAVDAGQGMVLMFLLVPLIPLVLLLAWAGAKLADNRRASRQVHGRQ